MIDKLLHTNTWFTKPHGGAISRMVAESHNATYNVTNAPSDVGNDVNDNRSVGEILWIYLGPVIFITGVIGNILVLVVMGSRRMQGTSTSFYLRIMALADFMVLITGMIPEWLEHTDIVTFKYLHPATCKLEKFSFYTCADTAIWILMIFTIDRFIAVCFPLSKKAYCVPSRAKFYALAALLVAITKNFHVFWTRGAEYKTDDNNSTYLKSNCGRPEPYTNFERFVRPWIAISLVSFVPFVVILICNIFIIRALLAVRRLLREQSIASQSDKTLIQMTVMCLSASFAFLICVAPSIVLLIGKPYWHNHSWYDMVKAINNQLVYVNHSINFCLYCLTGARFRQELMRMCKCGVYSHGSPLATTMYQVNDSRNASPNPQRNLRLQAPDKTNTNHTYAKMVAVNCQRNTCRPTKDNIATGCHISPGGDTKETESTEHESVL